MLNLIRSRSFSLEFSLSKSEYFLHTKFIFFIIKLNFDINFSSYIFWTRLLDKIGEDLLIEFCLISFFLSSSLFEEAFIPLYYTNFHFCSLVKLKQIIKSILIS